MCRERLPQYPVDAIEVALPDADAAAAFLFSRRPELLPWLMRWQHELVATFGVQIQHDATRANTALRMALARMGLRYGSWGEDYHAYHNENHALELLDGRLERLVREAGTTLDGRDRIALALFSACHDLRQRESGETGTLMGANEAASIDETARILAIAGFDHADDAWLFRTLELAIAGSTFDARPLAPDSRSNTAELAARGGPLAPHLHECLDETEPGWRSDRGRIYIKYGQPEQVESRPSRVDGLAVEVWTYIDLGLRFVFVDYDGFGRYELYQPGRS